MCALCFMFMFPSSGMSKTLCGVGRITVLEHGPAAPSNIRFKTVIMPAPHGSYYMDKSIGPMTEMWGNSYSRWGDRVGILLLAQSLQAQIRITSSDNNCQGNDDEFTIRICTQDSECDR